MKLPIGVIIKAIVDEKRIKVADIAARMGLTRQAIYYSYAKEDMSEGELARWTSALEVADGYIKDRWETALNEDNGSNANAYLMQHLARLEETFKESLKQLQAQIDIKDRQLETKDEQMRGLQKTVEVLLGKSEGVTSLMTTLSQAIPKLAKKAGGIA